MDRIGKTDLNKLKYIETDQNEQQPTKTDLIGQRPNYNRQKQTETDRHGLKLTKKGRKGTETD